MYGFAQYLTENGFNVVVYDARAHGESGGIYCTYGFIEQKDVSRAIDEIVKRYQNKGKFAVFGSSYGGAVALQAMANESRIACGVVESTFATLHDAVQDYATQMFVFFPEFLTSRVLKNAGEIARFNPELVQPEFVAREIHQPVRLVHGTDDKKISIKYGERIYRNLGSSHKEWVAVPGGDHLNLWKVDQGRYQKGSLEFLKKWINE
jgi:alpha-beta hydrolase superfamily lysophospholipase